MLPPGTLSPDFQTASRRGRGAPAMKTTFAARLLVVLEKVQP